MMSNNNQRQGPNKPTDQTNPPTDSTTPKRRPQPIPAATKSDHHSARLDSERRRARPESDRFDHELRRSARADHVKAKHRTDDDDHHDAFSALVAVDEQGLRRQLAALLRADGYHVIEARDGTEMYAKARASLLGNTSAPVELVVADVNLPKMSAVDALSAIRRIDGNLPVVIIDAEGSEGSEEAAIAAGADAVVQRPLDLAALRQLLHSLVVPH